MAKDQKNDVMARFAGSFIGSGLAELVTLPADVCKVRLQVQVAGEGGVLKYRGFAHCLKTIAAEEGPTALWKGIAPSLIRQCCYTSLSLVIYEPVRSFYSNLFGSGDKPNFAQRLLAGGTAGGMAIAVFNPAEVVKTQVQTNMVGTLRMKDVISKIMAADGVLGFWAGVQPNVARTFLVNAAELGTYDEAKTRIQPYLGTGLATHVSASGCAGFCSACVSTPVDVVKTRLMNAAGGERAYSGMFNAGFTIFKDEGPMALYKGFLPICTRKLIWCACFFVSYENIRAGVNAM